MPKSASTSLLKTLSKVHHLEGNQLFFKNFEIPENYTILGNYHSDVREFSSDEIEEFISEVKFFKQHIPPTSNNLDHLRNHKKVILLRNPRDIVKAYFRAEKRRIHEKRIEFKNVKKINEWLDTAENIGLLKELKNFQLGWVNCCKNKLVIEYDDLVNNPTQTINKIEAYFGLGKTHHDIVLLKERYSRESRILIIPRTLKRYLMKYLQLFRGKRQ